MTEQYPIAEKIPPEILEAEVKQLEALKAKPAFLLVPTCDTGRVTVGREISRVCVPNGFRLRHRILLSI